ncbi:MAG: hypothetical protein MJ211_15480 [Bacteroidales bacterium]|nr:hypothetical protein [Bacteroidales bacterium]
MPLYTNIDDIIKIKSQEFSIIGIAIMIYKNNCINYLYEYKLRKISDNTIWFLHNYIGYNYYLFKEGFIVANNLSAFKVLVRPLKLVYSNGNVNEYKNSSFDFVNYIGDKIFYLKKNDKLYTGIIVNEMISIVRQSDSYVEDSIKFLPSIDDFHIDNAIKNKSCSIQNGFKVGDGLLINDEEYFVLSESISKIDTIKSKEYQLYNNNTKEYCWLKYFENNYFIFKETEGILDDKLITSGFKERKVLSKSDWLTINNTQCDFELYKQSFSDDFYLQENWNNSILFYKGNVIDDSKILVLLYDNEFYFDNYELLPLGYCENDLIIIRKDMNDDGSSNNKGGLIIIIDLILAFIFINLISISKYSQLGQFGLFLCLAIFIIAIMSIKLNDTEDYHQDDIKEQILKEL